MRLGWITDPHINFCTVITKNKLYESINKQNLDALVVTGDVAEGDIVRGVMLDMQQHVTCPIYFVLGNHDYYNMSIERVREIMREVFSCDKDDLPKQNRAIWLPAVGQQDFVELTPDVALCGHDGWYDGGYANWFTSRVIMSDYQVITEFKYLYPALLFDKLQELAKESADYVYNVLPKAFETHNTVYLATHVPVFPENAVYNGNVSDNNWMPHFSNKHMGDAILDVMSDYPTKQLVVLQGHSHGKANFHPTSNVTSLTGFARYRQPMLNNIFEI